MCVDDGILFCFEAFLGQRIGRVEQACEFSSFFFWVFVVVSNLETSLAFATIYTRRDI